MNELQTVPHPDAAVVATATPDALVALWHGYLAREVAAGQIAELTGATYRRGMDRYTRWLMDAGRMSDRDALLDWMAHERGRGAKAGSVNAWLSGVRAFYGWAFEAGHVPVNPCDRVRGVKRAGTTKRHKRGSLTNEEMRALLRVADTLPARDRAIVLIMAYTAVRTVEVVRANVEDLHTKDGAQALAVTGKGHTEADDDVFIVHPDALAALRAWLAERGGAAGPLFTSASDRNSGGRLSTRHIRRTIKGAYRAAGIVDAKKTTHSLRHTAARSAIRNGAPLMGVQRMMRHANVATTGIYLEEMARAETAAERTIDYSA